MQRIQVTLNDGFVENFSLQISKVRRNNPFFIFSFFFLLACFGPCDYFRIGQRFFDFVSIARSLSIGWQWWMATRRVLSSSFVDFHSAGFNFDIGECWIGFTNRPHNPLESSDRYTYHYRSSNLFNLAAKDKNLLACPKSFFRFIRK